MIEILNSLYEAGKFNDKCAFPETLIFNEGWLLRSILNKFKYSRTKLSFPFLPFPEDSRIFSEAQLSTPFNKSPKNETNTHTDGIVGDFLIRGGTKSGIALKAPKYLAFFEAKMNSGLSKGTKNITDYNQLSRTVACIINELKNIKEIKDVKVWSVVLYPKDNKKIDKSLEDKIILQEQISKRIRDYDINRVDRIFCNSWNNILNNIEVKFVTWEDIITELKDNELTEFYEKCKQFNRPNKR